MATFKFEIGDKVKVVKPAHSWKNGYLNKVFTIDRYNPNGETCFDEPHYGVAENNCQFVWQESELELVETKARKYKVGDRVIIDESNIEGKCGVNLRGRNVVGTVTGTWGHPDHHYWVTCDEYPGGLFCSVKCLASEFNAEKIVITHDGKTTTATKYCEDGSKVTATARCAPEDEFDFRVGAEIAMGRLVDKLVFAKFNVIRVVFREGERAYSYKTRMQTAKVGMTISVPVGAYRTEHKATVVEIIPGAEYDGEFAMSAMKEIDIVEVPKYYNGKVVCIDNGTVPGDLIVGKIYTFVDGCCKNEYGGQITNSPVSDFKNLVSRFRTVKFIEIVE